MRMFKNSILVAAAIAVTIIEPAESSKPEIPSPFDLHLEPNPIPNSAGPVKVKLTIISTSACDEVTVTISGIDNLEYFGESKWTFRPNLGDTNMFDLSLVIPENDTSGIGITAKCANWPDYRIGAYFITDTERVSFYDFNPRKMFKRAPKTKIDMSDPPMEELWKQSARNSSPGGYTLFTKDDSGRFAPFLGDVKTARNLWGLTHEGEFVPFDSLIKMAGSSSSDSSMPVYGPGDRSKTWVTGPDGKLVQVDKAWLIDSLKQAKTEAKLAEMHRLE